MTALNRDIKLKQNGQGYILAIGKKEVRLSYDETEDLFCVLLKGLPCVENGIELAWEHRHKPRIKLIGYYGVDENDEISVCNWIGEVRILNKVAFRTHRFKPKEEVIRVLREEYGENTPIVKEEIYEASRKTAENELVYKQAEAYCRANDITMAELWAEIQREKKKGEL